jgi:hypothetical protein
MKGQLQRLAIANDRAAERGPSSPIARVLNRKLNGLAPTPAATLSHGFPSPPAIGSNSTGERL